MNIPKAHACLKTMKKTSVKFQKDLSTNVGGVAATEYLLSEGELQKYDRVMELQKTKTMSPHFFLKVDSYTNHQNTSFLSLYYTGIPKKSVTLPILLLLFLSDMVLCLFINRGPDILTVSKDYD